MSLALQCGSLSILKCSRIVDDVQLASQVFHRIFEHTGQRNRKARSMLGKVLIERVEISGLRISQGCLKKPGGSLPGIESV